MDPGITMSLQSNGKEVWQTRILKEMKVESSCWETVQRGSCFLCCIEDFCSDWLQGRDQDKDQDQELEAGEGKKKSWMGVGITHPERTSG